MQICRLGSITVLATVAWLSFGIKFQNGQLTVPSPAMAQGSLTPPAGQPRVTAPVDYGSGVFAPTGSLACCTSACTGGTDGGQRRVPKCGRALICYTRS